MAGVWMRAAALVALAACAAGCGERDGDTDAGEKPPPYEVGYERAVALVEGSGLAASRSDDPKAIEQALREVQLNLAAANGDVVCERLTATGRYELARLRGGNAGACAKVVTEIGQRRQRERKRSKVSKVVAVDLFGSRASALLRDPGAGETYRVPFARDAAGRWLLTSLVLLDAEAIDNPPSGPTPPFVDPPRRIPREDLVDVQTDFARDRGESVCDDLTTAGQREAESYGRPGESCPDAVRTIKDRLVARGHQLRSSRLLSASIDGGRATLLVKDPGRPAYRVPVVVGPGDWKLTSLRYAEPIQLARR
jgi:hypothetical protein